MIEVHELLDRTTPTELPPLDIDRLQRRARGRRHRRVAALGAAAVLVVAVAAVAVDVAQHRPKTELAVVPARDVPGAFTDADPASGRWALAASAPFSPRGDPFTGTTSDGRVLVWGGADGTGRKTDGGVYDPVHDHWEQIPPVPLSGVAFDWSGLSRDRLVVVGTSEGDAVRGAMFDLRTGAWTTLPSPPSIHGNVDGYAWDGEVLALLRTGADQNDPDLASPVVERWSIKDGWKEGASSPLSTRYGASISSDGDRLAVWGGATGQLDFDDPPTADLDQGAIYDVGEDRWTAMAPGPLSPRMQTITLWVDGQVVIAGGRSVWSGRTDEPASGAVYHPGTGRWDALPAFPRGYTHVAFFVTPPKGVRDFDEGLRQTLMSAGSLDATDTTLTLDLGSGAWRRGALHDVHPIAGTYIDTNVATGVPSNEPFAAQVLVAGTWRPVSGAPFGNRAQPGIAVSGERMVVVGGYIDPAGEPTAETWVLDLS